jgi:plastocyanin
MRITPLRAGLAAASFALFAGLGLAVAGQTVGAPGSILATIKNFSFQAPTITVPVGGSVTWTNHDGEPHTVTGLDGSFRSEALDEDDTYTFKFTKPGVYQYICTIHPRMRGTVIVK